MMYVIYFFGLCAVASWLLTFVSGIRMFGMLSGRLSAGAMLFRGMEWFNAANFKPEAAPIRQMFIRGFIGFFVCVFAIMILAMLSAKPA